MQGGHAGPGCPRRPEGQDLLRWDGVLTDAARRTAGPVIPPQAAILGQSAPDLCVNLYLTGSQVR